MKHSFATKITSSERGDVLAEFVIVFPLYIALISSCIWLGMLAMGRSRVLAAERYVLWGTGYRQSSQAGDILSHVNKTQTSIYADMAGLDGMSVTAKYDSTNRHPGRNNSQNRWTALNSVVYKTQLQAPSWLHGPISLLRLNSRQSVSNSAPTIDLYAYGDEKDSLKSVVLSRTTDSSRRFTSNTVGSIWQRVAKESFPSVSNDSSLSGLSSNSGSYTRIYNYELWSE